VSVFDKYKAKAYPFNFAVELLVGTIAGGTPTDPKVAESWLKTKLGLDKDAQIRAAVSEVMLERGVLADEAVEAISENKHLNGFRRDESGLYIEGRQVKAAIKEAANIRWPYPKTVWGPSGARAGGTKGEGRGKASSSFFAEHVFVQEDRIHLGVATATGVNQRFVHTWRGNGIQYEEYVTDAKLSFTVATDHEFTAEQWAFLWLTGGENGIGASRSQGYGRYQVTRWDKVA
jgi:hypothetical protein